jgi:hypothetical protein
MMGRDAYHQRWLAGDCDGLWPGLRPSWPVFLALCAARDMAPKLEVRPCPSCGEDTSQPSGDCDSCTGAFRTCCRVCKASAPGKSWVEGELPEHHNVVAGIVCPGSALLVTVRN